MARARDPYGAPEPQDENTAGASAAPPDDAQTNAAKSKRRTSAKKADSTDVNSEARTRSRTSRRTTEDETAVGESKRTARHASAERSSKAQRSKKSTENEGPIEIIKRAYDLGIDSTTSDRRAAARRRYGLTAATLETPASPEPKPQRSRSAKRTTKPPAEALRPEDTALTEIPESAELLAEIEDVEHDAALHVSKETRQDDEELGRDEFGDGDIAADEEYHLEDDVLREDDQVDGHDEVEDTNVDEREAESAKVDEREAEEYVEENEVESANVDEHNEEDETRPDVEESPDTGRDASVEPSTAEDEVSDDSEERTRTAKEKEEALRTRDDQFEPPVRKVRRSEKKEATKSPKRRKASRKPIEPVAIEAETEPVAKGEPAEAEPVAIVTQAEPVTKTEPVAINADEVKEPTTRRASAPRTRTVRIVGLIVAGVALVIAGIVTIAQSPEEGDVPETTTTSSSSFPGGTSSTTTPAAPGTTEAIRLSGNQPRQSALFRLPGGTVRVSYTSTGGELTVRVLRQASTGSGEVFTCNATCDRSATVSEDPGTYYLDVDSRESEWTVRVEY